MSFELAQEAATTFKGTNVDKKVEVITSLKSYLKRNDVDSDAVPLVFDSVRQGLASTSHPNLAQAALTCLVVLIKRMTIQDASRLKAVAPQLLPVLVDRLGDVKDRYRDLAMNSLVEFWKASPVEVEKTIKEIGFGNKSWRIREQSMRWLANIHRSQHNFSFRSFTPFMMKILEDANEVVRDTAKEVVIELFKNAPGHAKADLKKLLQTNHVRKTTSQYILSNLGLADTDLTASVRSDEGFHEDPHLAPPSLAIPDQRQRIASTTGSVTASVAGSVATSALISIAGAEMEQMDACFVASKGDLEYEIQGMLVAFEGRESEQNWGLRDKHITRLRGLLRGNAYKEYPTAFMAGIANLQSAIVKGMASLRTQLCLKSCELVKDLAIVTGPAIDPFVDYFLTTFVKLSAGTKKLVLQATQLIVSIILANVSYSHKLTAQIWIAMQDKNMNPRVCASAWLKILLDAHGESKSQIEHGQGIENIEKTIKKGLADPSPDVRTPVRETFWTFARLWPDRAEAIMAKLDVSGRKALEKANPNAEADVASGRGSVLSKPIDLGASTASITSSAGAANRNPLSGRVSVKKFAAEQRKKIESEEPSGGLHSGAVRGLGQPQRPPSALKRLETVPAMPRPVSPSSSTTKTTRTGSPPRKGASTRTGSPPTSPKRKAGPPPRPSPLNTVTSPVVMPAARPVSRRLTVLEQLVHPEWRVRVEGIVTVACLLAKKDPPGHPPGQKLPTLPPLDMLSPTLQKLLNDPQPDVVHHLLAPEVIPEIAKIIPVDLIVPRLLLLSEMEDEEHVKDTLSSSLPALKKLFTDAEAADMLSRALMSMGVSGVVPRKMSVGFFTTTQKRKIIHGIFIWMIEVVERHNQQISVGETGNEYFLDEANYKQYIHRLVPMITNTKPTSNNYVPLTTLLKVLRQSNQDVFDKVLSTFERSTVAELKRAWGQPIDDQEDTVMYEEKVVTVHEVLGDVKVGGLTTVGSSSSTTTQLPNPPSPPRSRIPVRSPPTSPRTSREFHIPKSPSGSTTMNIDEDLTMINLPQQSGLDKENEKPRDHVNGKEDTSPTRHHARTDSRDKKTRSVDGPLGTFAKDLKKDLPDIPLSQEIMDQQKLLINLIARLESKQMDSPGFHSLSRFCRKSHVDVIQDPPTDAEYLWQGGNKFNELLRALLEYLISTDFNVSHDRMIKLKIEAFDSGIKPLMRHQKPYFAGHESAVIKSLLNLRGQASGNPISHVVDDALLDFVDMVDADLVTNILLKYVDPYVEERTRYDETQVPTSEVPATTSVVLTLKCLAIVIKKLTVAQVDLDISLIAPLAITTMYDEDTEVRRQSVAMCVSLFLVLQDEQKVFEALRGIEKDSSKQNLLHYYFEHARRESEEMTS